MEKEKKFTQTWHGICCYKNHKVKKTFETVCIALELAIVEVQFSTPRGVSPDCRSLSERKGGTLAIALSHYLPSTFG